MVYTSLCPNVDFSHIYTVIDAISYFIELICLLLHRFDLNNIYLENNQNIQYIKHSKYRQDSETSNYCFYKSVS